jgi:hypothetical protein
MSRIGTACGTLLLGLIVAIAGPQPPALLADVQLPDATAGPLGDADAVTLPGTAIAGAVADITGDGTREVVRLVPRDADETFLAVEAWREQGGVWRRLAAQPVVRRGALLDAPETWWETPDGEGMVRVRATEPARLMAWNDGQRERLLLAAVGSSGLEVPCCLVIHEVVVESGELRLSALATGEGPAGEIHALDMSGDGVDELVVIAPDGDVETARVLRWTGEVFDLVDETPIAVDRSGGVVVESDGRPGAELLLSVRGPAPVAGGRAWSLLRLALEDGVLVRDQARAPVALGPGLITPGLALPGLLIADFDGRVLLAHWPTGERLVSGSRSAVRGYPLAVLGRGAASRVLLLEGSFLGGDQESGPVLRILDDQLEPVLRVRPRGAAVAFRSMSGTAEAGGPPGPWPYVGELPGGLPDGRAAFIFDGQLLAEEPGSDCERECVSVARMAALPGMAPVGVAGRAGRWLALARTDNAFRDASRSGGRLLASAQSAAVWSLAATDAVLTPSGDALELGHHGAATHSALPGVLLASADGFRTELSAPPGSLLHIVVDGVSQAPRMVSGAGHLQLAMPPEGARDGGQPSDVRLLLVTPAGLGMVADLEVATLQERPELAIEVGAPVLSFSVPVSGRASPTAALTFDGQRVELDRGGRFDVEVSAPPWPRTVTAVAVDPFGRVTRESLTVIGFIDYRQLPWPGIALVLTIVAGIAVYLRAPRPVRAPVASGETGTLEELSDE